MRGRTWWGPSTAAIAAGLLINSVALWPSQGWAHAGSVAAAGETAESRDPPPETQIVARCPAELRLVASVVNERRPQLSLAVVRNRDGARMLPLGGRLDRLVLVAITPEHAELIDEQGARCTLPVFDRVGRGAAANVTQAVPEPRKPVPAAVTPNSDPKARAMFTPSELANGLRALGDGNYLLSRELLQRALKNPGGAAGGAHFRLAEREGRTLGMELRGVREGSTLARMGLASGDVVKSVNGIDVTNPLGMLEALRSAREADTVTLTVTHEGKERALRYMIE
jgi:hypothetical protein